MGAILGHFQSVLILCLVALKQKNFQTLFYPLNTAKYGIQIPTVFFVFP